MMRAYSGRNGGKTSFEGCPIAADHNDRVGHQASGMILFVTTMENTISMHYALRFSQRGRSVDSFSTDIRRLMYPASPRGTDISFFP